MRTLKAIAIIAGFLLGATSVFAADPMAPMAADSNAPMNWEGFYVGVWGGYHAGDSRNTACVGTCVANVGINGLVAGVTAGYDFVLENDVVIGGFLSVPLVAPKGSTTLFATPFNATPQFALIAAGRVGIVMGNALPYIFAGGALANVTIDAAPLPSSNTTHFGGVIGTGLEYAVTEHVTLDARYVLGYLGSAQYDFCPAAAPACQSSYDELSHSVSVGLNYRF